MMNNLISSITQGFATPVRLQEVEDFFTEHPLKGAERAIAQSEEVIKNNIRWLEKNKNDIELYLEQIDK